MSRYDGLIIPRSYSEYINKTDAATLQQALQLSGVLSGAVAAGDNKAVTSNAVNGALSNCLKKQTFVGVTEKRIKLSLKNSYDPCLLLIVTGRDNTIGYTNIAYVGNNDQKLSIIESVKAGTDVYLEDTSGGVDIVWNSPYFGTVTIINITDNDYNYTVLDI